MCKVRCQELLSDGGKCIFNYKLIRKWSTLNANILALASIKYKKSKLIQNAKEQKQTFEHVLKVER